MYYAEKIINGVLCHKDTPDGEWKPFQPQSLTCKIEQLRDKLNVRAAYIEYVAGEIAFHRVPLLFEEWQESIPITH
jgi:hypothetical protein